jgi:hypothetical protein
MAKAEALEASRDAQITADAPRFINKGLKIHVQQ